MFGLPIVMAYDFDESYIYAALEKAFSDPTLFLYIAVDQVDDMLQVTKYLPPIV